MSQMGSKLFGGDVMLLSVGRVGVGTKTAVESGTLEGPGEGDDEKK